MKVEVCVGKACKSRFSSYIVDRIKNDKIRFDLKNIEVNTCPCTGNCKIGPSMIVDGEVKTHINPVKASNIIQGKPEKKKKKQYKKK